MNESVVEKAPEELQKMMDRRLNKYGWQWNLISTLTENLVRVQIAPSGILFEMRIKSFNGKTLEDAVVQAEKYINKNKLIGGRK